ncbi:MAG: Peptidase M16 domain protein [Parcubacteria group bacterium GW2011_GWB1_41_6]|nr:MAG: Peptidase M16 domain protein [Parcubacteria group bacterium GW2011_GWB1_41_6]KKS34702.1 MAG: Peptidase M16 domain protein [Parcubacteria group bacterium GW2011_GWC2_42_13]KKS58302.1 MAG: Peptidase M16 domain protein [Parcubacteria group bacterium GW2011_GWA2_42_35]KKS73323.1 MAG: Peptidase M16 domain protein [Parcubacteria group bacterium GW2011_GWF2_42_7]
MIINYQKKILPDGKRIILAPMKNTSAVTLLVLFGTGSKNETKRTNGVSHFLEHLFFKGTKTRPNPGDIHKIFDGIGAEHNAFTSKELTGFWVKCADKNFNIALEVVSDLLLNPLFDKNEIEKERGVILQEISMYEDLPQRRVAELFETVLYGNQPAGWDTAGTKESVSGIKREDILKYRQSQYTASNTVVSLAGNINPEKAFQKIQKAFEKLPKTRALPRIKTQEKQASPQLGFLNKKSDQTHLILGFRGFKMYDEKKYALSLLSIILGGNTSSRLFMEIREKLGLAYYVGSASENYTDCGYLAIRMGIPHSSLKTALAKTAEIATDLRKNRIGKKDLNFAKDYIRGSMALSLESSDEVASFFGEQFLFLKKILQPKDILRKFEKVSEDDIIKVARQVFQKTKANLAVIGPYDEKQKADYKKLLSSKL